MKDARGIRLDRVVMMCVLAGLAWVVTASRDGMADEAGALRKLQSFLRIRSDQPKPDYAATTAWLKEECASLRLNVLIREYVEGKPVVICSLKGSNQNAKSVGFNAHVDVVPSGDSNRWQTPPFEAAISLDADGGNPFIVARGVQDMKSVAVQYLLAMKQLLSENWRPLRNVHLLFVPDEEIGGEDGMSKFVESVDFSNFNFGVLMDEGLPVEGDEFFLSYGERQPWWLNIRTEGVPGHGATLPERTASTVMIDVLTRIQAFRNEQRQLVESGKRRLGEVVGVNFVALNAGRPDGKGGYVSNVIPPSAEARLDIRVPPTIDEAAMDAVIEQWLECADAKRCPEISTYYASKVVIPTMTSLDGDKNPWAKALFDAAEMSCIKLRPDLFPASTDARFFRKAGVAAFGFSPINGTSNLLHKDNEKLSVEVFLRGVPIYANLIRGLADSPHPDTCDDPEMCPMDEL
mmetsp:Transcript_18496/g.38741  ORF Transcript_18496/g.38741 Transcript_18496/m.38741 type:complete len:462 (-) Transcript_18496:799-2184(-)